MQFATRLNNKLLKVKLHFEKKELLWLETASTEPTCMFRGGETFDLTAPPTENLGDKVSRIPLVVGEGQSFGAFVIWVPWESQIGPKFH